MKVYKKKTNFFYIMDISVNIVYLTFKIEVI